MLFQIRHTNIVKLHGFCLHHRCMFLVYEYMERGSLFYALNMNDEKAKELSWSKRVDIISGTANGLSHRHHDCFSPIVHKDVTSNNILLNSELHVVVSDLEMLDFLILILQIRHYKLEHMGTLHQSWLIQ
ncbi:putative leucine-rich repeat receptor-like protein kinase [Arachis hypogaea]|nr:putative leucine-rich repeat receptor-like protein kinase [Arachis hypogaea]